MSSQVFSPFAKATGEVFKLLLDLDTTASNPKILEHIQDSNDSVDIVIGIIGDLSGMILYRFPKSTMLEMVAIMSGMEFEAIDEFVLSAMGEIANIISGNALMGLSSEKINCDILPPRVVIEDRNQIFTSNIPVVNATIQTSLGDVELLFQVA